MSGSGSGEGTPGAERAIFYNVQALRALAAFLAIFVHTDKLLAPAGIAYDWLQFGNSGVDLFFVISGFVMVHTSLHRPQSPAAFMQNRIIRVVPLYWLLTLAVFALALAKPHLLGATRAAPDELLKSLFFIPFAKADGKLMPVLFVGWTLNYEMFFYLLFALGLWIARGRVGATVALVSLALAVLVTAGLVEQPAWVALRFYSAPVMLEFALGMGLALAVMRGFRLPRGLAWLLFGIGLVALILPPFFQRDPPRLIFAGIPGVMILASAVSLELHGAVSRARAVQMLGAASYALYLVHAFVLQAVAKFAAPAGSAAGALAMTALGIAAAIGVAMGVHLLVERPLNDRLRRWAGHRRPVTARAEAGMLRSAAKQGDNRRRAG